MSLHNRDIPIGVHFLQKLTDKCCPRLHFNRELCYRISVVFLTYIAYMCYHLSRRPISVVKAVLNRNCSNLIPPNNIVPDNKDNWCDWAPFNGTEIEAKQLLGELDSAFLFCYAIAMFLSGIVAERVNLRYFLSFGMVMSGIFCYLFGIAKTYNIHNLWYYIAVQGIAGIFQTTGWPGVVTVMSNWFGKKKNGLIFGLWNSHTSLGNILGSIIAAEYVEKDWALSFIIPGLIIGICGFIIFLFLVINPGDVNCLTTDTDTNRANKPHYKRMENRVANVQIPSSSSSNSEDSETTMGATLSADLAVLFDVGGIIGAIAAGAISDSSGMSATTCVGMLYLAVPTMLIYQQYGSINLGLNIFLLIIVGILVNGPYALITTAVSAELGTHQCLDGNSKALATVTAIIDGTGSIGAAIGPLLAGFISGYGWHKVFIMLMVSDILALILLLRLVKYEIIRFRNRRRDIRIE